MDCNILQGDALELLRTLPPESVHTCVTSPPYYNLRDYGVEGRSETRPAWRNTCRRWSQFFVRFDGYCGQTELCG